MVIHVYDKRSIVCIYFDSFLNVLGFILKNTNTAILIEQNVIMQWSYQFNEVRE